MSSVTSSNSTISSSTAMSTESIRPIYDLVELDLEEYEENDLVLDTIHELMIFFKQSSNCTCRRTSRQRDLRTCFEKVEFKRFFECHFELKALEKTQLEFFIKSQLMSFEITQEKNNGKEQQRHNYRYSFNSTFPLCQPAYLKLCGISENKFSTIKAHYQLNGLTERIHGNTGHARRRNSKVFVDLEISSQVKQYLTQYGNIYGLPSPMRHRNESENFIYLPTGESFTSIYNKYKNDFYLEHDENEKVMSYDTFRRLWYDTMPNLKFQSTGSDLCKVCEIFRKQLQISKNDIDNYKEIELEYEKHRKAAELERQHYNNNIIKSQNDLSIIHICYDWAQHVSIPYSPQQVGSIYFKSAYAVHLFGICKTGQKNQQINFIIAENEFPKGTGKGANITLNMVYRAIKEFTKNEKNLQITCDNCSAQNKNNLSLFFWCWLCMMGLFENITINFMLPGHTKFICDSFFGKIKKTFRNQIVNTIDDIEQIINNSAKGNIGLKYNDGIGWNWYDFEKFFSQNFVNCSHLKNYYHFCFSNSAQDLEKVYCSKKSERMKFVIHFCVIIISLMYINN